MTMMNGQLNGERRAQPRICIVDDDEAVGQALRLLVRSFGWQAESFPSALAFLAALQAPPDCLLLDLNMPEMNGAELLESLAARGVPIRTIMITAQKESPLLVRAEAAGARAQLTKPFDDEALKTCIESVLAA
ncbi:MAG: response regulator [Nevskia sp.]|nr:response regulator [Nevskia sp.]